MALARKSILLALAGAALLPGWAAASHYGRDYPRDFGHYDRYGNPIHADRGYVAPWYEPRLSYPDYYDRYTYRDRERLYAHPYEPRFETPLQREQRIEYERAQRGELDGVTTHPNSPAHSPG
jgi:hypothetical protein